MRPRFAMKGTDFDRIVQKELEIERIDRQLDYNCGYQECDAFLLEMD